MRTTPITRAVVATVATATVALSAAPVGALTVGDLFGSTGTTASYLDTTPGTSWGRLDYGGGGRWGPTTEVENGTIVLEPLARILDVELSADSVVATARVSHSPGARSVTVRWGDGEESVVDPRRPVAGQDPNSGIVEVHHTYAEPADQAAFSVFVTTVVTDAGGATDVEVLPLTIVPRYLVTQWSMYFRPLDLCDGPTEEFAEYEITQTVFETVDGTPSSSVTGFWRTERARVEVGEYGFERLEPSIVRREMTAADPPVTVTYDVVETDPWFDDTFDRFGVRLHPSEGSGRAQRVVVDRKELQYDCRAELAADVEVQLVVPAVGDAPPVLSD